MPEWSVKHGMHKHPIYRCWEGIIQRCTNPKNAAWPRYGGRGITVCERWREFINFRDDMFSSWQPGLTIDRIDNDAGYYPGNCRWVTQKENNSNRNKRLLKGFDVAHLAQCSNIDPHTLRYRINQGWPAKDLTAPVGSCKHAKERLLKGINVCKLAESSGLRPNTIRARIRAGWSVEDLTLPLYARRSKIYAYSGTQSQE